MPPKKKKGKKAPPEPEDKFKTMPSINLQQFIMENKEEHAKIRARRNYIQMDRDMVEKFYQNS